MIFYALVATRNLIAAIALEHYSLTTVLFPVTLAGVCLVFIPMVLYRRQRLAA